MGYRSSYLTFPKSAQDMRVCVYMMDAASSPTTGTSPETSCQGPISEACMKALENPLNVGEDCYVFPSSKDFKEIEKVCPKSIVNYASTWSSCKCQQSFPILDVYMI